MKRTAIYLRVSTDKQAQEGDSIPAQRDALMKYVKEHNYIFVGEYLDDGISGTKEDRAEFQRMMEDVKRGLIELILVTKLDRIHRSLRNFLNMQDTLDKYNCDWLAIWEPMYDSSTPQGRMIINTMMNLAQFEAEQTGQRIRQVFQYKREKGEILSGKVPCGLKIENKHLVADENFENVKKVFEYYQEHGNLRKTVDYAISIGVMLGSSGVKKMLKNERYKSFVGADLFNDVQMLFSKNIKYNTHRTYIFTGLIVCAECGGKLGGHTRSHELQYYRCLRHFNKGNAVSPCGNSRTIGENVIERYLLDHVKEMLTEYLFQKQQDKPKDNSKRIAVLQKKINKLKDLYLNDLINLEEYKKDKQNYEKEIASLQTPVQRDFSAHEAVLRVNLEELYPTLTQEQKRAFWRSIISKITFSKNRKIEVFFL